MLIYESSIPYKKEMQYNIPNNFTLKVKGKYISSMNKRHGKESYHS